MTGADPPTASRAAAMFSMYWRQPEYEEYAEVAIARARLTPCSAISRTVSANIGRQLRLPQ